MNHLGEQEQRLKATISMRSPASDEVETRGMSSNEFALLAEKIHALTGIVLQKNKRQLANNRLRKRLTALGLNDFGAYLALLGSEAGADESNKLINVMTTNLTSFFREKHHFDDLKSVLSAHLKGDRSKKRLRIWSAACSTGEEPYSIAMTALQVLSKHSGIDLRILATDVDTDVLAHANSGVYLSKQVDALPKELSGKYFNPITKGQFKIAADARKMIQFNYLNLHKTWPMNGQFDAIFCRNVLIYFSDEAKRELIGRMIAILRPGGTLYLGHSESMLGANLLLSAHGRTIFRKSL